MAIDSYDTSVKNASNVNCKVYAQEPPPRTTPPGFNKSRRDLTKLLLLLTAASLFTGANGFAVCTSASSIFVVKQGTLFSTKNVKWGALSVISFVVSLTAFILLQGYQVVDEDKAYTLKMSLYLTAKSMQAFWAVVLGLFLFSTLTSTDAATPQNPRAEQTPPTNRRDIMQPSPSVISDIHPKRH